MSAAETKPLRWSVGLLTAPRPISTINRALRSLHTAGWSDGADVIHDDRDRSGCYQGWLAMVTTLSAFFSLSDRLLLIEDDCLLSAGLRDYLDANPPDPAAWCSLYTAGGLHSDSEPGWREVDPLRQAWGSVAYVVAPTLLRRLLIEQSFPTWRDGTDRAVGIFCRRNSIPLQVHSPSFAEHVGDVSALDRPGGCAENRRSAVWIERIERGSGDDAWSFHLDRKVDRSVHVETVGIAGGRRQTGG